jgi:hypothetical protein
MNDFEPWVDFNHNDANYQSIIERMVRARWIEGVAITTPDSMFASLTHLGQNRMEHIRGVLERLIPDVIVSKDDTVSLPQKPPYEAMATMLRVSEELNAIAADLKPPEFSITESETMLGLVLVYSRKKASRPPPSPPFPPGRL